MERRKTAPRILITVVIVFAFALIVMTSVEAWCRFSKFHSFSFPPHLIVYDKNLGYRYNPEHPFSKVGFRGTFEAAPKKEGVTRIVCLGESSTSCDLLEDGSQTWTHLLERYLNSHSGKHSFEVINAAVGGYGSRHVLAQVRYLVPRFSPDIVIAYLGWNGRGVFSETFRETPFNVYAPQDNFWERLDKILINHSYCYFNRIRWRVEPFLNKFRNHPEFFALKHESYAPEGFFEDLDAIIESVKTMNAIPVVIRFPVWAERLYLRSGDSTDHALLRERIRGIGDCARKKGAKEVIMSDLFSADSSRQGRYFFDGIHMNRYGCEVFARALSDSLYLFLQQNKRQKN